MVIVSSFWIPMVWLYWSVHPLNHTLLCRPMNAPQREDELSAGAAWTGFPCSRHNNQDDYIIMGWWCCTTGPLWHHRHADRFIGNRKGKCSVSLCWCSDQKFSKRKIQLPLISDSAVATARQFAGWCCDKRSPKDIGYSFRENIWNNIIVRSFKFNQKKCAQKFQK